MVVKSPIFTEYATLSKQFSLQCPCTTISVKYEEFVEIKPFFHELCQSNLISDGFIQSLYSLYEESWNTSTQTDIRRIAVFQFQTLRHFCELIQKLIEDNRQRFLQTEFIQTHLISSEQVLIQIMSSFIADFISMTPKTFFRALSFVQNITAQNLFVAGASVTSVLPINHRDTLRTFEKSPYPGITYIYADSSSCTCSSSTANICMGLSTLDNDTVVGFKTGCYMVSALLNSTLEVFHNQTFIDVLTNSSNYFHKLNSSFANDTVETLFKKMFITHWSNQTIFERYFNGCAPNSCQYTITKRYEFLFIVTVLVGLIGGISSALQIFIPLIITKVWPFLRKIFTKRRIRVIQTETNRTKYSMNDRGKQLCRFLKQKLIEFNLFESTPPSANETILLQQRYTTRFYIIMFLLSLIILIAFKSIKPQVIYVTTKPPTLDDFIRLEKQYSKTLHCPCEQITIEYKNLIQVNPQYYEICTSQFISSDWINVKFKKQDFFLDDFQYHSEFYFQLLSTLCHMSNQTIEDNLQSFYRTQFVTNEVLTNQSFQIQLDSILNQFNRTISESFQRILQFIKLNIEINQFTTPMNSAFSYKYNETHITDVTLEPQSRWWSRNPECERRNEYNQLKCMCEPSFLQSKCEINTVLKLNESDNMTIPGMFIGWFPYESVLISTLECFYNETCFSQILSQINSTKHFTILNSSIHENDTIESLANQLFVQSWLNETLFKSYFKHCNPLACKYSYETRLHLIYILTTIIGLVGGLNIVFHLLSPLIIKSIYKLYYYIRQCKRNKNNMEEQSISLRLGFRYHLGIFYKFLKRKLIEINLFSPIPPSTDPKIIQRNRRTTRIYLILLLTTSFILIFYISLKKETVTITIQNPSVLQYKQLFILYSHTLQCPCTRIAIKHKKFITELMPQYHQVCTSTYTSSQWLEELYNAFAGMATTSDLSGSMSTYFDIISELCELSKNMLNVSLSSFAEADFVTVEVLSPVAFDTQIETIIGQFKRTISNQFTETFKLIQTINIGNQLVTVDQANWQFILRYNVPYNMIYKRNSPIHTLTLPTQYDSLNCSCGVQSTCTVLKHFHYEIFPQLLKLNFEFKTGCQMLDVILKSDLTCFYDPMCVTFLTGLQPGNRSNPHEVFTYSLSSMPNATIEQLLAQLFVNKWIEEKSFDIYFDECKPAICQYSDYVRYNSLYIATLLIALFGGLTKGMHLIVSFLSIMVYKIIDHRKKKIEIRPKSNRSHVETNNDMIEVISETSVTTDRLHENPFEDQRNSKETHRDRILLICLSLLCIIVIIASVTSLFLTQNKEQPILTITVQTTLDTSTTNTITESTPSSMFKVHKGSIVYILVLDVCYKTLKYQNEIYPTERNPSSLITGDFNQDSYVDLAITNADSDSISILLGNGNAKFQKQRIYSTGIGSSPQKIVAGDLNDDGLLDLVITLNGTNEIVILFGITTNNLFDIPPYNLTQGYPHKKVSAIEIYDWNLDGFNDLFISYYIIEDVSFKTANLWLNIGDGRDFVEFGTLVTDKTNNKTEIIGMVMALFNRAEGTEDSVLLTSGGTMKILYSPEFDSEWKGKSYPTSIARLNFNNDQMDDIAVLHCDRMITVFVSTEYTIFDRNYLSFGIDVNGSNRTCSHSLKVADLNQDDEDDLIFIDTEFNAVRVALNAFCDD
ncbi:unnamed protein product [Adineta steineri]|uniref:Uncharacterized protein n=1 Tax=Adineta steineri TaxID=433720 RepID=A0A815I463_9BILA|nr:unnamed protein product [Adineta steineri]CAF1354947.1 unnamed protein product [Adineta steineri]CAF1361185.1 unnamed protein product [Adineta steineri]CAF3824392.1 unnamed protein product [Adineta steineri]CAF4056096.1 unnamed protein product [Adineta steineri]